MFIVLRIVALVLIHRLLRLAGLTSPGRCEWFGANYRLAFTWPLPQELWGDSEILVYRRRHCWFRSRLPYLVVIRS